MTFRQEEYNLLINDKETVVTFTQSIDIILMDAMVRPASMIRHKYLTPHRNLSHIPLAFIYDSCPRCHSSWESMWTPNKSADLFICSSNCGIALDALILTKNYPPQEEIEEAVADKMQEMIQNGTAFNPNTGVFTALNESPPREAEVNIPATSSDTMARGDKPLNPFTNVPKQTEVIGTNPFTNVPKQTVHRDIKGGKQI
jgi:hypothetical protein